ncbi:Smith-Magenis syndrome chromosome region, candidate 7 homolog (human), isoform CRA_a [Mus musculus]|nr:Smith-Magenis syndrome chromosome region, candidate 7 homolog (human), isoform CRA_a [Mus musculus]
MAEFSQKQRKQSGSEGLGSVVDFLLANARLVLGVGGAAVLGIATLAVKRVRPRGQGLPETSTGEGQTGELGDGGTFEVGLEHGAPTFSP